MKIKTLTLSNFRAFPGRQPFDFDGKNLLIYGENGSGKSSVFHALKTFFSLNGPALVEETRNVFSGVLEHWLEVEFDDGQPGARWDGPPTTVPHVIDIRVIQAAVRQGCLDYRALLDTNYGHGEDKINLFMIAVGPLLDSFLVTTSGGITSSIGQLWREVGQAKPAYNSKKAVKAADAACLAFNQGFVQALNAIGPKVVDLLKCLPVEGLKLESLDFSGVFYDRDKHDFDGMTLTPRISLRDYAIIRPHHFLNEARLSALGLAIYLAGRLTSVPTGGNDLKLLVMDDVLIGIDLSNRLPLLDLLHDRFSDWQIVLLTHDKTWFEMTRTRMEDSKTWKWSEIFEGSPGGSDPAPVVVQNEMSPRQAALKRAGEFLTLQEYQPAANYARSAFEASLKDFCEKRSVPVQFKSELRDLNSGYFLGAIETWIKEKDQRLFYAPYVERAKLFRRIILNPLSHADAPAIKYEVDGAIKAVTNLENILGKSHRPPDSLTLLEEVRKISAKATPTEAELQIALANLRSKFAWSLGKFCERHNVEMPFTAAGPSITDLWDRVKTGGTTLFTASHPGLATRVNAEREWLVEEIDRVKLQSLTRSDLQRLIALLNPNSDEKTVLDVI